MERMEDNHCRSVFRGPCFPCLDWFFNRFLCPFRLADQFSFGPLGPRSKVSHTRNNGAKARACQTPKIKTLTAPSRCCCVQMARSYQVCLTSASVNTTRCLVDVLFSAWSKKKRWCNAEQLPTVRSIPFQAPIGELSVYALSQSNPFS